MATGAHLEAIAEAFRAWLAPTGWLVLSGRRTAGPARRGAARSRLATLEDRLNWTATALAKQGKPRLRAIQIATCDTPADLPKLVVAEARTIITVPRSP